MPKRLPEEISQAVRELKAFETEKDHMTRCEHFNEGIESLDEYLYFCQEPRHVKQAENIKFTYTKKLLQELQKLTKSVDREEWFSYYFSLLTAQKEVDSVIQVYPELKKHYEDFLVRYAEEAIYFWQRLLAREKSE